MYPFVTTQHVLNVNELYTGITKVNSQITRHQVAEVTDAILAQTNCKFQLLVKYIRFRKSHFVLLALKRPPVKAMRAFAKITAVSFSEL